MAGFAALPLIVEVAFGADPLDTGTLTWTDISDYVRRGTGVDFSRGWDTESGEPQAGRLTFTLNNESGDFTPGATGSFGEIRNRLPIRVSATIGTATGNALSYDDEAGWYDMLGATYDDTEIGNVVLWTGLVETWRIYWENGVRSQVAVTAVDRWAAIRRLKIDGDLIRRVVTDQAPAYFWPLTAQTMVDNRAEPDAGAVPFIPYLNTAGVLTAAGADNPQTWAAEKVAVTVGANLSTAYREAGWLDTGTGGLGAEWSLSFWLNGDGRMYLFGNDVDVDLAVSGSSYQFAVDPGPTGGLISKVDTTTASVWHHLAVSCISFGGGGLEVRCYLDGVKVHTDNTTVSGGGWPNSPIYLGLKALSGVGYVGVWDRQTSDAEVLEQYRAGTTMGVAGETAAIRAERLLTYVTPAPSLSTAGTFTATMSKQDLVDKSLADALFECATAERGAIYVDTGGWPVLTSRSWRTASALSFTIPAIALGKDVSWTLDDQQLANSATVDRMVGDESAGQVKAKNEASVTTYGEQSKSLQIWVDTDAQLLERANAEANIDAVARPRSSDLMVDLLTKEAAIPAATLLAADIGDRIAVSGLPAEAPGDTQFYIENIADRVSHTGWERTFTVSPRADYFTVEDATYGVIDSVFVLAF